MKVTTLILLLYPFASNASTITFDDLKKGSLSGWNQGFYGENGSPIWKVEEYPSARSKPHVLKQSGQAIYSWLVKEDPFFKDGSIEADIKIVAGKEDPEAGLVWRHRDGKNYYYIRMNAVKDNVVFYRMNNGKKELIKEADTKVGHNTWRHVKVKFKSEQVDIFFDGKQVISIRDDIFKDAGRAGAFTTADTVSVFDNITIEPNK